MHLLCRARGGPAWATTACLGLVAAAASLALGTRERHHNVVAPGAAARLCTNASQLWSFATGDTVRSSPAVGADGTVYVGSDDNKLYAVTPEGQLKWSFATGMAVDSSPAVGADGTVYVGSDSHKLYAVTPEGQLKWSFATGDRVYSKPAVGADGTVYVGSDDHKLYAVMPLCGCESAELQLCGAARTDSWTCMACVAAHQVPLKLAGCSSANASDFCSHAFTPCVLAEERLCGTTTNSSADCLLCCGEHQQMLGQVRSPPHSWRAALFLSTRPAHHFMREPRLDLNGSRIDSFINVH